MTDELDLTEIDPIDTSFWAEYEEATAIKVLPPDGAYTIRMPEALGDEAFVVRAGKDGKRFLSITLDPVVIAGGEFDGANVRYLRVSTRPVQEFVKKGDGWEPGRSLNASDAADVLMNFGTGDTPSTVEEWKQAYRRLTGQVSPHPFYLTWNGYDKQALGKAKYLRSKDFPRVGETRPNYIERVGATGETYKVYANLGLGRRGAAPKA